MWHVAVSVIINIIPQRALSIHALNPRLLPHLPTTNPLVLGTPMLRGYMHGFFMEMKLYNKLRAVSKPFEYEEHRKKKIQAKIDEKRESRIIAQKRLPKINRDLAGKMMQSSGKSGGTGDDEDEEGTGGGGRRFVDSRFAALFEREEFQRDETSEEFKLRNPR